MMGKLCAGALPSKMQKKCLCPGFAIAHVAKYKTTIETKLIERKYKQATNTNGEISHII